MSDMPSDIPGITDSSTLVDALLREVGLASDALDLDEYSAMQTDDTQLTAQPTPDSMIQTTVEVTDKPTNASTAPPGTLHAVAGGEGVPGNEATAAAKEEESPAAVHDGGDDRKNANARYHADGSILTAADEDIAELEASVNQEMQEAEDAESEDSPSAPDPDDEQQDPDWSAGNPEDTGISPKPNQRKRPRKAGGDENSAKRSRGSSRTRELEKRLSSLEKSMQQQKNAKRRESTRDTQRKLRSATKKGQSALKFEEFESPNSDQKVCRECYEEEKHNTEFLLKEAWKHPWWEMLSTGACSTCDGERFEIVWGTQSLRARGRMDFQLFVDD